MNLSHGETLSHDCSFLGKLLRTNAKAATIQDFLTELIKGKPEPGLFARPVLDRNFQTNVKCLFIIADLTGAPLIRTAAQQGKFGHQISGVKEWEKW